MGTNPDIDFAGERRSDIARRDAPRVTRTLRGTIVLDDGTQFDCSINDVSATGAGIACLTAVLPGTSLSINLPGLGAVPGRVAWVSGVRIGLAFAKHIDPSQIVPPKPPGAIDRRGRKQA